MRVEVVIGHLLVAGWQNFQAEGHEPVASTAAVDRWTKHDKYLPLVMSLTAQVAPPALTGSSPAKCNNITVNPKASGRVF